MTRRIVVIAMATLTFGAPAAWADCTARLDEARGAVRQAEAAVEKAKPSGKDAAKGPLAKAKKGLLHAEAECAQGYAEEARMLAEKL
jgi:hypothetical protein